MKPLIKIIPTGGWETAPLLVEIIFHLTACWEGKENGAITSCLYPIYDQLKNHTLWGHAYLCSPYKEVPLALPAIRVTHVKYICVCCSYLYCHKIVGIYLHTGVKPDRFPGILWMATFFWTLHDCILIIFPMLLYKLIIWEGPVAHFGQPLFKSWFKAFSHTRF